MLGTAMLETYNRDLMIYSRRGWRRRRHLYCRRSSACSVRSATGLLASGVQACVFESFWHTSSQRHLHEQEATRAFREMARLSVQESGRGATCPLPANILCQYLSQQVHKAASPCRIADTGRSDALGGVMIGQLSAAGHSHPVLPSKSPVYAQVLQSTSCPPMRCKCKCSCAVDQQAYKCQSTGPQRFKRTSASAGHHGAGGPAAVAGGHAVGGLPAAGSRAAAQPVRPQHRHQLAARALCAAVLRRLPS